MKKENPKDAKDDSAEKEEEATPEVRQAVDLFLSDSYKKLLQLNNNQEIPGFKRKLTARAADIEDSPSSAVAGIPKTGITPTTQPVTSRAID